jgi:hypothetical protein
VAAVEATLVRVVALAATVNFQRNHFLLVLLIQ